MDARHRDYLVTKIIALTIKGIDCASIARQLTTEEGQRVDDHWVGGIIGYFVNIQVLLNKEEI